MLTLWGGLQPAAGLQPAWSAFVKWSAGGLKAAAGLSLPHNRPCGAAPWAAAPSQAAWHRDTVHPQRRPQRLPHK